MGCASTRSKIEKIKQDLKIKERQVGKLNDELGRLDKQIEKLQTEGREDEVQLKVQDYEQMKKEKTLLTNDIQRRKKTLKQLEETINKNNSLIDQNDLDKKQIDKKKQQAEYLIVRQKQEEKLAKIGDANEDLMNEEERQEQNEQQYKRVPNSQKRIIQEYPPPNAMYQFKSLETQQNKINNQPQIQKVQSGIYN
ncbi:unnamed protein product [Paramecium sonneborni]|uniref:Uncharacterized protein n=1 Tax=Paramecium sonneborni TaxID=65129 RepID=A0A8S1RJA3_9CILI|nr:unnamed protein product [Paramecium sonneborni]